MHHLFGLNCQDVTRLVSDSMDRSLPLIQRLKMRFHIGMCKYCGRFAKQMRFLRKICQEDEKGLSDATLPDETRRRIRQVIRTSADES